MKREEDKPEHENKELRNRLEEKDCGSKKTRGKGI